MPVGEEAEVADAHKAARQQVEQEAAQELFDRQDHEPLLVAVSGVSPTEGNVVLRKRDESVVRDGDAVSVGTEIAQRVFRPTEGPLGVDDPVMMEQSTQPGCEGLRLGKRHEVAVELERAFVEGGLQPGDELTAKDTAEHLDGKEEDRREEIQLE